MHQFKPRAPATDYVTSVLVYHVSAFGRSQVSNTPSFLSLAFHTSLAIYFQITRIPMLHRMETLEEQESTAHTMWLAGTAYKGGASTANETGARVE